MDPTKRFSEITCHSDFEMCAAHWDAAWAGHNERTVALNMASIEAHRPGKYAHLRRTTPPRLRANADSVYRNLEIQWKAQAKEDLRHITMLLEHGGCEFMLRSPEMPLAHYRTRGRPTRPTICPHTGLDGGCAEDYIFRVYTWILAHKYARSAFPHPPDGAHARVLIELNRVFCAGTQRGALHLNHLPHEYFLPE